MFTVIGKHTKNCVKSPCFSWVNQRTINRHVQQRTVSHYRRITSGSTFLYGTQQQRRWPDEAANGLIKSSLIAVLWIFFSHPPVLVLFREELSTTCFFSSCTYIILHCFLGFWTTICSFTSRCQGDLWPGVSLIGYFQSRQIHKRKSHSLQFEKLPFPQLHLL